MCSNVDNKLFIVDNKLFILSLDDHIQLEDDYVCIYGRRGEHNHIMSKGQKNNKYDVIVC